MSVESTILYNECENCIFKIIAISARDRWVDIAIIWFIYLTAGAMPSIDLLVGHLTVSWIAALCLVVGLGRDVLTKLSKWPKGMYINVCMILIPHQSEYHYNFQQENTFISLMIIICIITCISGQKHFGKSTWTIRIHLCTKNEPIAIQLIVFTYQL